ncbi:hypothetical protein [Streptomyces sp. NPDC003090]|uniref:hypothetical protein n=1 Tax=Streptomyces sp. NPDC003090 TaxID=3154274 RepID=UPI003807E5EB
MRLSENFCTAVVGANLALIIAGALEMHTFGKRGQAITAGMETLYAELRASSDGAWQGDAGRERRASWKREYTRALARSRTLNRLARAWAWAIGFYLVTTAASLAYLAGWRPGRYGLDRNGDGTYNPWEFHSVETLLAWVSILAISAGIGLSLSVPAMRAAWGRVELESLDPDWEAQFARVTTPPPSPAQPPGPRDGADETADAGGTP